MAIDFACASIHAMELRIPEIVPHKVLPARSGPTKRFPACFKLASTTKGHVRGYVLTPDWRSLVSTNENKGDKHRHTVYRLLPPCVRVTFLYQRSSGRDEILEKEHDPWWLWKGIHIFENGPFYSPQEQKCILPLL